MTGIAAVIMHPRLRVILMEQFQAHAVCIVVFAGVLMPTEGVFFFVQATILPREAILPDSGL